MQDSRMNQETMTEPTGQQNAAKNTEPTTHPEDNGASGKMFTQEEVNKIVSERLNRERTKAEPSHQDTREIELSKRESRLACREFLEENKYIPGLLDVLDTTDLSRFKEAVKKLEDIMPEVNKKNPRFIPPDMPGMGNVSFAHDSIARAFNLK